MSQKDVPVKTDAGLWEIKARALGLAPRIRTALLLVDGVKSAAELERMMVAAGVTPGALQLLLDKGLIRFPEEPTRQMTEPAPEHTVLFDPMTMPRPANKPVQAAAKPPAQAVQKEQPVKEAPIKEPQHEPLSLEAGSSVLEIPTLSEIETILGVATELEMQTIIGVATKLEVTPQSPESAQPERARPESAPPQNASAAKPPPKKERPTAKEQAQRTVKAIEEAEKQVISTSILKMNLIVARAHIANALDQYLEVDGYVLRQKIAACESRGDLELLFPLVEAALHMKLEKAAVARLMGISRALLER
ncbi:MAG: hypothetical protein JO269_03075 [Burkholderiaceae bacterium]|nr:hypothetical protein [Burkholderiaceae bacterium]